MNLPKDTILENRYRLDELLMTGRRGATYRAFDTNLGMAVAIKEVSLPTTQAITQFKQQALILTGVRHRALPWVIHHFSSQAQQYLVIDFVGGKNLWEFIEDRGQPLQERQALDVIIQICQGVHHLHQQTSPIIHGDIKPQNIKFAPNGQAVLVGFGVVSQSDLEEFSQDSPRQDPSGYIAPEQYSAQEIAPAADIYALGATLYAIVTGQEPSNRIGGVELTSPEVLNPQLSALTAKAIRQAMELNPSHRPLTVLAWQKELEYILKSSVAPDSTKQVGSPPPAATKPTSAAAPLPSVTDLKFWLVDPAGLGYPIGSEALTIGRSEEADVILDASGVSPLHAKIRMDNQRCLVMDTSGGPGTVLLNEERLGSGWYPLAHGDTLVIGAVRFDVTNIQPVKLASLKSKSRVVGPRPLDQPDTPAPVASAAPTAQQQKPQRHTSLVVIAILLLASIAAAAYLQFGSGVASNPTLVPTAADTATPPPIKTVATVIQVATQPGSESVAATTPTEQPATATVMRTPTPENTPTSASLAVASPTPTPAPSLTPLPSPTPTEPAPTLTATPAPTGISPTATPTADGPTAIPFQPERTIAQIGAQEVIDVDINPQNPNEVYTLVKGDGIYRSSNGGDGPWGKMGIDASSVVAFVIDPTDPARFYAPTWNAVLKSSDGGNTWEANSNGLLGNKTVDVVTVDPVNPTVLYAGVGERLAASTDGGRTWSAGVGGGLGVARLHTIVVDPFDPNTIYVAGLAASLYKSVDSGITFTQLPANVGQGAYGLAAHPTQQGVYLVGINSAEAGILKSEDGVEFRSVSEGLIFGGADSAYTAIVYAPSNPSIIYTGTGHEDNRLAKGIFKSTDGGETWALINNGLNQNPDTGQPYYVKSIAVHPADPDIVFAATGAGLYQSRDGGTTWQLR